MKAWILLNLLVCLAVPSHAQYATNKTTIRTLPSRFTHAALEKNWVGLGELFAADAVMMPPGVPTITGSAAIAKWYASSGVTASKFEMTSDVIEVDRNLATCRGRFSLTFTSTDQPEPQTREGRFLWVLKKGADGVWRIAIDMFDTSPPATAIDK